MVTKHKDSFKVMNEKGLHTRPSTELVKCVSQFRANVTLTYQGYTADARSVLGILMLAATRGSKIQVEAEGEQAKEAVEAVIALSQKKFNVKY